MLLWLEAILSQPTPKNSLECPHNWPVGPPYSLGWQAGNECTGSDNIWKPKAVSLRDYKLQGISISVETQVSYSTLDIPLPFFGLIFQQEWRTNQYLIKRVNSANRETEHRPFFVTWKKQYRPKYQDNGGQRTPHCYNVTDNSDEFILHLFFQNCSVGLY